ncbi:LuxR family transcriptional regulator [Ornithinibacillus xuwenensis]|uniref:LuxR family transcriptional regulator n=1 Tax=Ornithinibacillus xuwenensis TaxID=3144668 RepID=A0ABU9XJV8_9BACI
MTESEGASKENRAINEVIQEVEKSYFIGRQDELKFFHEYTQLNNSEYNIIHFYGNGGIGKTFLLQEFSRVTANYNLPYIYLDSQDFSNTPQAFIEYFHSCLISTFEPSESNMPSVSVQDCLEFVKNLTGRVVIAIDTYEQMDELDRWFRNAFLRKLSSNCYIILASRKPLTGEWIESPAWRKVTKQIELKPFSYDQTLSYLSKNGISNPREAKRVWQFTKGHPLTLSLATMSTFASNQELPFLKNTSEILTNLTKRWLNEVKNEQLYSIIEIAALFHEFDQNCIAEILNHEISNQFFHDLIALSFIQKTRKGWSFHELIRDAIQVELKARNPERFEMVTNKIIQFYYHRIIKNQKKEDIESFFYHIGDDLIQSIFFQNSIKETSLYLEPVGPYNFHEVEAFFGYVKANLTKSKADFYHRTTNTSFHFYAPLEHNQRELEMIGPEYVQKIGYDGTRLLKNNEGETLAISIIVPINQSTISLLENEPVSRSYFKNLTEKEKAYFHVPSDKTAGHFIRYLEYKDPSDSYIRSYVLYSLFPLLFHGGKVVTSTPLDLFQDLLHKFGFQKVPGADHYDYCKHESTPTYVLDISGTKLIPYLKQFLNGFSQEKELELLIEEFSLTNREQEIMALLLENKRITEIANELYLAEITVKKALSRIYKKANVKNRSQLMNRIMEII